MIGEHRDAVVEFSGLQGDLFGVARSGLLAPAVVGGFEQGDEGGWRGEECTLTL